MGWDGMRGPEGPVFLQWLLVPLAAVRQAGMQPDLLSPANSGGGGRVLFVQFLPAMQLVKTQVDWEKYMQVSPPPCSCIRGFNYPRIGGPPLPSFSLTLGPLKNPSCWGGKGENLNTVLHFCQFCFSSNSGAAQQMT